MGSTRILPAVVVFCVLLASAIVYSNYARKKGIVGVTEDTPAFNVRVLLVAVSTYEAKYNSLPSNLSSLGPPPTGTRVSGESANLIDSHLASGSKNGYLYRYVPSAAPQAFIITADPGGNDAPTAFHYFAEQTAVVRVESGRAATVASQPDRQER